MNRSYDYIIYSILSYNYDSHITTKTIDKIKRILKQHSLSYDPERIEYLFTLRNDLQKEISLFHNSKYYIRKDNHGISNMSDFDIDKMKRDYILKYKLLTETDMNDIILISMNLYYLR